MTFPTLNTQSFRTNLMRDRIQTATMRTFHNSLFQSLSPRSFFSLIYQRTKRQIKWQTKNRSQNNYQKNGKKLVKRTITPRHRISQGPNRTKKPNQSQKTKQQKLTIWLRSQKWEISRNKRNNISSRTKILKINYQIRHLRLRHSIDSRR